LPTRLEVQLGYLRAHPGCVAVGGECWHVDWAGMRTGYRTRQGGRPASDPLAMPAREPWIGPFVTARTAAMRDAGGYRAAHYAEDTDLFWRLEELGQVYNVPEPVAEYRLHSDSVSSTSVLSGRISACNSQRTALGASRRRTGRPDLGFDEATQVAMRAAGDLPAMVRIASADMEADEVPRFEAAVAAKLLELASYRPYRLDAADRRFIGQGLVRAVRYGSPRDAARNLGWRLLYKHLARRRYRDLLGILMRR
jgi:hypothetical protein